MRLSKNYIDTFKEKFTELFGEGEIYLFGSRVDDSKKGGDIDLYLKVEDHSNLFEKKIKFLSRVKRELGEQKIDIVFNEDKNRLIEQEALKWGIKL
ncbi:MAG: nucleotidyltransferase domain-containing protein [Campylobacterota bacterium]|nr:nucleotidyltransferase domain-containing protein [Campylobacterota bacterium]